MVEEEDSMSSSFFEPVNFETGPSSGPDSDVQALSFIAEPLNINIGNPWDPPGVGTDISSILCMFFFY